MDRDETDERLERLLGATHDVAASAEFASRVMGAIEAERVASGLWTELPRAGRFVVPVAAACAIASVVWAVFAFRALDEATLGSQDGAEQSVVSSLYGAEVE